MNNWIETAKRDIDSIIRQYALIDYKQVNCDKDGKRKYKKHRPYALSDNTNKARKMYALIYGKNDTSKEVEAIIKGYLLPFRLGKVENITLD